MSRNLADFLITVRRDHIDAADAHQAIGYDATLTDAVRATLDRGRVLVGHVGRIESPATLVLRDLRVFWEERTQELTGDDLKVIRAALHVDGHLSESDQMLVISHGAPSEREGDAAHRATTYLASAMLAPRS